MRIIILCTGDSSRSQMAEGYLKHFKPEFEVYSAGTAPATQVHPLAVKVMKEDGVDISGGRPQYVDEFISQPFDYVITVCDNAKEIRPVFTGEVKQMIHIGFEDPAEARGTEADVLPVYRSIRDEIKREFKKLIDRVE